MPRPPKPHPDFLRAGEAKPQTISQVPENDHPKLAERLLADFRQKLGRLNQKSNIGKVTFAELADTWFDSVRTNVKPGSAERVKLSIKQLKKHFGTYAIKPGSRAADAAPLGTSHRMELWQFSCRERWRPF